MLLVRFYVYGRIRSLRYVPQSKTDQERVDVEFTMQTGSKKCMLRSVTYTKFTYGCEQNSTSKMTEVTTVAIR